jgi:hypothetical protein
MGDYLPKSDGGLLDWSGNYDSIITADPVAVGLTAAIALVLHNKYVAYQTSLTAAKSFPTRGGSTVNQKQIDKRDLIAFIRQTAKTIQGCPTVTDQQKYDLGITVKKNRSPINPPTQPPVPEVVSVSGRTIKLKVHGVGTDRRGKPAGCFQAVVFTWTPTTEGETPPSDLSKWVNHGGTSRTQFDLVLPNTTPAGSQVFITALWTSPRIQPGPAAEPISTYIGGGVSQAA